MTLDEVNLALDAATAATKAAESRMDMRAWHEAIARSDWRESRRLEADVTAAKQEWYRLHRLSEALEAASISGSE